MVRAFLLPTCSSSSPRQLLPFPSSPQPVHFVLMNSLGNTSSSVPKPLPHSDLLPLSLELATASCPGPRAMHLSHPHFCPVIF